MGLFERHSDPIKERERELARQMKALENQIAELNDEARTTEAQPRVRSTVHPRQIPPRNPFQVGEDVVLEAVDNEPIKEPESLELSPSRYNELGVKKLDFVQLWKRVRHHLKRPPQAQSKFVNYLAAGSIQGIRPLRYERRIARNRFLLMFGVFFVVLIGLLLMMQGRL